jgi:hypothetical protein
VINIKFAKFIVSMLPPSYETQDFYSDILEPWDNQVFGLPEPVPIKVCVRKGINADQEQGVLCRVARKSDHKDYGQQPSYCHSKKMILMEYDAPQDNTEKKQSREQPIPSHYCKSTIDNPIKVTESEKIVNQWRKQRKIATKEIRELRKVFHNCHINDKTVNRYSVRPILRIEVETVQRNSLHCNLPFI